MVLLSNVQVQRRKETAAQRAVSRLRRTNDRNVLGVHEDYEDDENAENGVVQRSPVDKKTEVKLSSYLG